MPKSRMIAVCCLAGTIACVIGLEKEFVKLEHADRLVIKGPRYGGNSHSVTINDPETIKDVVQFVKRYPRGWNLVSGAGGDYDLLLYEDQRVIGQLGITKTSSDGETPGLDTVNFGDYFRRVPAADVEAFADRLGLLWPPPRDSAPSGQRPRNP